MSTYEEQVLETTLSHMESHLLFARRQITQLGLLGDETYTKMWDDLTEILNSLGRHRSSAEWQDYWKSLRLDNKQKVSKYLEHEASTGNLPNETNLTDTDIRISKIFGRFGTGLAIVSEFGIKTLDNIINPIDLFEDVIGKTNNKAKGNQSMDVSNVQTLEMISFMLENVLYSLGEETDVDTRTRLSNELVIRLNSLGDKRDLFQWTAVWENMYRHCDKKSPTSNEFVNLVAAYKECGKRNKNQRAAALNELLLHVNQTKSKKTTVVQDARHQQPLTVVKTEIKKEPDVVTLEDDDDEVGSSLAKDFKTGRKEAGQSMDHRSLPSTSTSPFALHNLPTSQSTRENNFMQSNQTAVIGDRLDLKVLQSIVAGEVKIAIPSIVDSALNAIIKSPEFAQKVKNLFKEAIILQAEELHLKWRTEEEAERNRAVVVQNQSLRDLSNRICTSANVRSPDTQLSRDDSFLYDQSNADLENLPPQKRADTSQEFHYESPDASQTKYFKATEGYRHSQDDEDSDENPSFPHKDGASTSPLDGLDWNAMETFRRSNSENENPSKIWATYKYKPSY